MVPLKQCGETIVRRALEMFAWPARALARSEAIRHQILFMAIIHNMQDQGQLFGPAGGPARDWPNSAPNPRNRRQSRWLAVMRPPSPPRNGPNQNHNQQRRRQQHCGLDSELFARAAVSPPPLPPAAPHETCLLSRIGPPKKWPVVKTLFACFRFWRSLAAIWMFYVLVKFVVIDLIQKPPTPDRMQPARFKAKLHCLFVGRFNLHEGFASLTALLFALLILAWRFRLRLLDRPYKLTVVQFLLLDCEQLNQFYARLDASFALEFSLLEAELLSERQLFLLETMCFRLQRPASKVRYILRANRTPASHLRLRRRIALLDYISSVFFTTVASILLVAFSRQILDDARYLRVYPGCDPHLQLLSDTRQLPAGSITFTPHHVLSGLADTIEDLVLWIEGGLMCSFGMGFICITNYDLILYWRSIGRNIQRLQMQSKELFLVAGDNFSRRPLDRRLLAREGARESSISELQASIADFFNQVERVDVFLSDVLDIALIGWLLLAASYTYNTKVKSIDLPTSVMLLLLFIVFIMSTVCSSLLELHRRCTRSYGALCSLMAYDRSRHRPYFALLLDSYTTSRTCYHLFHQYPFKPITFLKIVGYSFSGFFLIAGIFQERNQMERAAESTAAQNWSQGAAIAL